VKTFHSALALTAYLAISFHISWSGEASIYFILTASLCGASLIACFIMITYRSLGSYTEFRGYEDDIEMTQVTAQMKRPWRFNPGQYAYLCVPAISTTAVFQSHPLFLVWWDQTRGEASFLASAQRGFTRDVLNYRGGWIRLGELTTDIKDIPRHRTMIEGPYGQPKDLGAYGTVLMVASGVGIAGHLSYLKYLLEAHAKRLVVTQKIRVHWQVTRASEFEPLHITVCH
jgi:predicted ferric reductase